MVKDPAPWCEVLSEVIGASHLATAYDLVEIIGTACARVDMGVELYLADIPERPLRPVRLGRSIAMDGTPAGRAFQLTEIMSRTGDCRTTPPSCCWSGSTSAPTTLLPS